MDLDNGTPFPAAFTVVVDVEGREHAVVVVKGTFDFPDDPHKTCAPSAQPVPLILADTFWGEPGFSSPRAEMDFAHVKARCDVLLEATAHAPDGRATEQMRAGLRIGSWTKVIDVVGDRVWLGGLGAPGISAPRPFVQMPLSYDRAFGGVDGAEPDPDKADAYRANPVGRGWSRVENAARVNGVALPNLEDPADPVREPWGRNTPMSFGPLGRGWSDRLPLAGTYDEAWQEEVFPFLPKDFNPDYYQAAAADQQIPFPKPGTEIVLAGLTPEGQTAFRLPEIEMPMLFAVSRKEDVPKTGLLDTIVIEPDLRRFSLTWRASLPLQRDIFEINECIIGARPKGFWRARAMGKSYYPSLGDLVRTGR
ncbi:MAG: DUF2169 domain-containing protein [Pseudomonadota bacterium]